MRDHLYIVGLVVSGALITTGCANSPAALWKMSPQELTAVEQDPLCNAFASAKAYREPAAAVDAEVARRGLTCERELAWSVSNCEPLRLLRTEAAPQGTIFTVQNTSNTPRTFRTYAMGLSSELQQIGPGETRRFGIGAPPVESAIAGATAMRSGDLEARLHDCLVPRW